MCFGDGANPKVFEAYGIEHPRAIFITYPEHAECLSATLRLRSAFLRARIFARAQVKHPRENAHTW